MNTSPTFTRARRWHRRHSRVLRLVHKVTNPMREVDELLAGANLPTELTTHVRTIVQKTRLRLDEKQDITRELIAHGRDAIEAGTPPPEAAAALGQPRVVARLLRRAVKRKRGWLYHARVVLMRTAGLGMLALAIAYAGLWLRWQTAKPTITRNFIAELNAPFDHYTQSQRAWPVYQDVSLAWERVTVPMSNRQMDQANTDQASTEASPRSPGILLLPGLSPDHPDYQEVARAVKTFRPQLDRWAQATRRPVIGTLISDRFEESTDEQTGRTYQIPIEPAADPQNQLWGVHILLPHLQSTRKMATVFAFDARLAAAEDNGERVEQSLSATFHLARQLGQEPFLISGLVAIAVHHLGENELLRLLEARPDLFDADRLTRLAHTIEQTSKLANQIHVESEKMNIEDFLQRGFTDDGRGNGRLTKAGLRLLAQSVMVPDDLGAVSGDPFSSAIQSPAAPVMAITMPDRRSQQRLIDAHYADLEATLQNGPQTIGGLEQRMYERIDFDRTNPVFRSPVDLLLPALTRSVDRVFQARARTTGTQTALAIEVFRRTHARLPETLDELVPTQLPAVPADPFDPGAPIKYVRDDNTYALYFAGADGHDDSGQRGIPDDTRRIRSFRIRYRDGAAGHQNEDPAIPDGDWLLYPRPAE